MQMGLSKLIGLPAHDVLLLILVIAFPLGFYTTSYNYESHLINTQASHASEILSQHIETTSAPQAKLNPEYVAMLTQQVWYDSSVHFEIIDANTGQVTTIGSAKASMIHSSSPFISNNQDSRFTVVAHTSLRPLVQSTFYVLIFSLISALAVRVIFNQQPNIVMTSLRHSLNDSKKQLIAEIKKKEELLESHKKITEAMHFQALHDELTSLPNRRHIYEDIDTCLERYQETRTRFAVMLIDLNRFKEINDTLGHTVGDKVISEVAKRIRASIPKDSILARLGGDEFAVLLPEADKSNAELVAKNIQHNSTSHIVVDDYRLTVQGSNGIVLCPDDGTSTQQLLRHADIAMYHAKQMSKPFSFYESSYEETSFNQLNLTSGLRHAIDTSELDFYFQPKVNLQTGEVIGAETLARWQHPELGHISPEVFIPLAEEAGMINQLTESALMTSLRNLELWRKQNPTMSVAINISPKNLLDEGLPRKLHFLLSKYDIKPENLTLEITESSIMHDPEKSKELINGLANWGIRISVDDFGTGYSSLAYLKQLTVHELKIDRSFILNLLNSHDDQVIVQSTINLAHDLKIDVVAEGIEDQETYELLAEYGCDYAQGFHICKPCKHHDFIAFLSDRNTRLPESKLSS